MQRRPLRKRKESGLSVVDVIVGTALLLTVFLALIGILRASLLLSALAKAKAGATSLANAQMEYLRGLSYDALGTSGGIPSGAVAQNATSTVDGITYGVRTFITYVDDPKDGLGSSDQNGITTDYKVAKVTVSYTVTNAPRSVSLVSNFAPPGIESSTGGGTLSLHVVNAAGTGLGNASVRIFNTAVSPAIDFTTYSNSSGYAIIGGAATSTEYQIVVSRSGYSSAQTYTRDATNVNPTPGYLTVVKDQTTSATFAIDLLASLTLSSFSPATTTTFRDSFASAANLAAQNATSVSGGALILATDELSGSARSVPLSPNALTGWGLLSASLDTPTGTTAVIRVDDGSGIPVPDSDLPGNSSGFSSFPVSLTSLATSSYPTLSLEALLTSDATSTTPSIYDWSLSHSEAPALLPNVGFTLTGTKTIGTDSNSAPIYKTVIVDSTGASGSKTLSLEWDRYALQLGSTTLETCEEPPFGISPGASISTALLIGNTVAHSLPVVVTASSSLPVQGARVVLTKSDYAATVLTSPCGLAFFNGVPSGTYTATASAPGYTTTAATGINVSGATATTTISFP